MGKSKPISDVEYTISERIEEAGRTLRGSPMPREVLGLAKAVGSWPDMVRNPAEAYGYDKAVVRRVPPTAEQLDRLEQVLGWLLKLPADQRPIVAAKMHGFSFGKMAAIDPNGRSPEVLRKAYWRAINYILGELVDDGTKSSKGGLSRLAESA